MPELFLFRQAKMLRCVFTQPSLIRCLSSVRLLEIGQFENRKLATNHYETGQLFLHKVFGFRGIVLFPWTARVYDRDALLRKTASAKDDDEVKRTHVTTKTVGGNELKGELEPYYQILIDERDLPHIRLRSHGHTMLSKDSSRGLIAIHGLECVSHTDILPYVSTEDMPIEHEYLRRFFNPRRLKEQFFQPTSLLSVWREKYSTWLELSDVHRETTENVRITVVPFYMGCKSGLNASEYWWRYSVRLENFRPDTVTLRERHWKIFSNVCNLEQVHEKGVVGLEPELSRRQPAFQYSSHVMQRHPSGHMWGTYKMEREDRTSFDCRIPSFSLESKRDENVDPIFSLLES